LQSVFLEVVADIPAFVIFAEILAQGKRESGSEIQELKPPGPSWKRNGPGVRGRTDRPAGNASTTGAEASGRGGSRAAAGGLFPVPLRLGGGQQAEGLDDRQVSSSHICSAC
jgi:hypothetical protein